MARLASATIDSNRALKRKALAGSGLSALAGLVGKLASSLVKQLSSGAAKADSIEDQQQESGLDLFDTTSSDAVPQEVPVK